MSVPRLESWRSSRRGCAGDAATHVKAGLEEHTVGDRGPILDLDTTAHDGIYADTGGSEATTVKPSGRSRPREAAMLPTCSSQGS
jgi:hypothetical protein